MDSLQIQSTWEDQQREWRERMQETGDIPHPVPVADGLVVTPQVYIVSMPKSGRTWLRVLIGKALIEFYGLNEEDILEPLKLSVAAGILPTEFIHDGTNIALGKHWRELDGDKSAYKGKKVVFLVREPKDLLVSSYFSAANRKRTFDGSISDFIRSDQYGIHKVIAFYKSWADNQTVPEAFLLLRYEDMQAKPEASLDSVLRFMGVENMPQEIIAEAVQFGRFENMREMERSGSYNWRLSSPNLNDEEAYKVRKGKVGGYVDYLSAEDVEYISQAIAEARIPFL